METVQNTMNDRLWTALFLKGNVHLSRAAALRKEYGSVERIWKEAWQNEKIKKEPELVSFFAQGPDLEAAGKAMETWAEKQIRVFSLDNPLYPPLLKTIPDPPPLLFLKGRADILEADAIAVVGARKCTGYGEVTAHRLGEDLARSGYVVVSGMAYGVDASAHKGALHAGGATIAVLGSGVDICYPPQNHSLYRKIEKEGLLVSENLPGTEPTAWLFPRRNRIISGLSQGVIVVEGDEKSGSLITADQALEQGRDVYFVPGPVHSRLSRGPNRRIQEGAGQLLLDASDVPPARHPFRTSQIITEKSSPEGDTPEERKILQALSEKELSFEEMLGFGFQASILQETLSMLELKGWIHQTESTLWAIGTE